MSDPNEIVEIKGPGGWAARLLGRDAIVYIFALALLAALLGWIPSPMTEALRAFNLVAISLDKHDEKSVQLRRELQESVNYQNTLLRTICRGITPKELQSQCEPRYRGYEEKPIER